jgi:hypothetical protein
MTHIGASTYARNPPGKKKKRFFFVFFRSVLLETSNFSKRWLKHVAHRNMLIISFTLETSHSFREWLKDIASQNIQLIPVLQRLVKRSCAPKHTAHVKRETSHFRSTRWNVLDQKRNPICLSLVRYPSPKWCHIRTPLKCCRAHIARLPPVSTHLCVVLRKTFL